MSHKRPPPSSTKDREDDSLRPWLLAGAVALFVARPLLPSEGTLAGGDAVVLMLGPLLLLVAWALRAVMRCGGTARLGMVDLVVLFLVVWHGAAAWRALPNGAPRAAINAAWQLVSLAALFFIVRQLVVTAREVRAIAAVMIGLAVAMSALGYHQYFYSIPRDQARYRADPEGALKEARVAAPPGSRQRVLFEQRINSSEPMATFALTNSLAGFLVPWLLVSLGICAMAGVTRARDPLLWIPAVLCAIVTAGCLVLTKSRAGYVASAAGAAALALWTVVQGAQLSRKAMLAGGIAIGLLIAGAIGVGAIDREVLSEAGKSLGYRLQYWQATCAMIADHPWFGCGPGQFQSYYTQYMLPEASETVADPHNFLLEVCATAGLPSGLALLAVIVLVGRRLLWPGPASLAEDSTKANYIYIGAASGFLLAWALGPLATVPLGVPALAGGLASAALAVGGLAPWVRRGTLTAGVLAVAAAALLINLLAGGGINFAGVAGSLWLLAALCLASTERVRPLHIAGSAALFAVAVGLAIGFYLQTYGPVLACNAELDLADVDSSHAESHLQAAAAADPQSAEPRKRLAMLEWEHWRSFPSPAAFERWTAALDDAVRLDPHAAPLAELKGDICLEAYQSTHQAEPLMMAVAAYRRAVNLYPNSGALHAKLAVALAEEGEQATAADEARVALQLDALTPHADQKLPGEMRERLQTLAEAPN
ncbi:MAG TPA: O-antigen ligase family protein [Pirellulales bacterium]|nr:O-antigen ligase family protein [Pirellulales bacterium]